MATWYVDFDLGTTEVSLLEPVHAGSEADPFDFSDLKYYLANMITEANDFYCRGSFVGGSISVDNGGGEATNFYGWGDNVWRLSGTGWNNNFGIAVRMYDAILYDMTVAPGGGFVELYDCFVKDYNGSVQSHIYRNTVVLISSSANMTIDGDCLSGTLVTDNGELLTDLGGGTIEYSLINQNEVSAATNLTSGSNNVLSATIKYIPHFTEPDLSKFSLGYNNYGVGLSWGSAADVLYVDLSNTTSGCDGTMYDPYNYRDFIISLSGSNTNYKFRGSYQGQTLENISVLSAVSIDAWDTYNYGPWRISTNYGVIRFENSASEISNAILDGKTFSNITLPKSNQIYIVNGFNIDICNTDIKNVVIPDVNIYMNGLATISASQIEFENCFFGFSGKPADSGPVVQYYNQYNISALFRNCYTMKSELSGIGRLSAVSDDGTEYNVDNETAPNWNDVYLENFDIIENAKLLSWAENRTFYVNIDNSYSAVDGLGTLANPWSILQFQQYLRYDYGTNGVSGQTFVRDGDYIKLKGTYASPSDVIFLPYWEDDEYKCSAVTLEAWDPTINGHWKVKPLNALDVSDFSISDINQGRPVNLIVKDGVLQNLYIKTHLSAYSDSDYTPSATPPYGYVSYNFKNCIISGDTNWDNSTYSATSASEYDQFDGCTFVDGTFYLKDQIYVTSAFGLSGGVEDPNVREKLEFNDCVSLNGIFDLTDIAITGTSMPKDLAIFNYCEFSGTSAQTIIYHDWAEDLQLNNCTFEIEPTATFPAFDDITPSNQTALDYRSYDVTYTRDIRESAWISADYNEGYMDSTRKGAGSFSFAYISYLGHIGAFYFGPVSETIEVGTLEISAVLLQPTVSVVNAISASVTPRVLQVRHILLQPTIYATQDLEIDFVGVPLSGPTPLVVEFTASVNFSAQLLNKYKVKEYRWCFNYDYDNNVCLEDWVITTANPTTHVYRGHAGQQFSVKLCVTLETL